MKTRAALYLCLALAPLMPIAVVAAVSCSESERAAASSSYDLHCEVAALDGERAKRCENYETVCYVYGSELSCYQRGQ